MRAARVRTFAVVAALATVVPGAALTGSATGAEEEGRKFLNRTVYPDQYRGADWQRGGAFSVVVDGLDNPRQLVWSNQDDLVVAEAGHGNPNNCGPDGCVGRSGQISRIAQPGVSRGDNAEVIVEGFISAAGEDGSFATGADGVDQSRNNRLFVAMTEAPPDVNIPDSAPGHQLGKLMVAEPPRFNKDVWANVSRYEYQNNPDNERVESNPYATLSLQGKQLVADAAGDSIIKVPQQDETRLWARLPEQGRQLDPVPTSITKAPDGTVFIGGLGSLVQGNGAIYQYRRDGTHLASLYGFSGITGVAVTKQGNVFVSELFADQGMGIPGQVTRVNLQTLEKKSWPVPFPAGLVAEDGNLFVSAFSVSSSDGDFGPGSSGQVWRMDLPGGQS